MQEVGNLLILLRQLLTGSLSLGGDVCAALGDLLTEITDLLAEILYQFDTAGRISLRCVLVHRYDPLFNRRNT
jgi:hypothetical protein